MPVLLTAYLVWRNRNPQRRRIEIFLPLALFFACVAAASLYVRADRAAVASTLEWFHRHDLFWSTITAIVSAVLVSRRRALIRSEAPRAWTAVLPMDRARARWQAMAVESVPAVALLGMLAFIFGGLSAAVFLEARTSAPLITWASTTCGALIGAALSYLLRPPRQAEVYEDSRYVPRRRRAETPIPIGSLSALGSWPLRQMFASAKPRTLARVLVPILLAVPLGSQAADVMVTIGLLTALGAVAALVAAVISVSARALRWLNPLPLEPAQLARRMLVPALASMLVATAIESWLIWVLGSPVMRSIAAGVLTLTVGAILTVFGFLIVLRANSSAAGGRL